MKSVPSIALIVLLAVQLAAQTAASKSATATVPASMRQMILPSHDSMLLGVFYLAAGTDPHPTAIILHGFPGFEQNLDLAQTLGARGWNVLAMHYRGSWGGSPTIEKEASLLEEDSNLLPLSGTSGEALAREIYDHKQSLNFLNLAPAISSRPVLILTANDGLAPADHLLAEALRKSGDAHVAEQHWDTDHSYSDRRSELANAILEWAQANRFTKAGRRTAHP